MFIYKTTCLINGKIYIGQTVKDDPKYLGSGFKIMKAIKKYGRENFIKEIIQTCESPEQLNEMEIYWIKELNSTNDEIGYNIGFGGRLTSMRHSDETKQKISQKKKGIKCSEEHRKNISKAAKGRKTSDETKRKLSEAGKGHEVTHETREKISKATKGKIVTEEQRKNLSNGVKKFLAENEDAIIKIKTKPPKEEKPKNEAKSKANSGKNNSMYGKNQYQLWVEEYGQEEADRRDKAKRDKCAAVAKERWAKVREIVAEQNNRTLCTTKN